jgi:ABC-type tungstate transport system permease subunit
LIHSSLGAQEVLADLLAAGEIELDPQHTIMLPGDRHRQLLKRAADERAYTLVGRIPFLNGKIPSAKLEIMVRDDPRMRRPYVVVVARAEQEDDSRLVAARELAQFLRSNETQQWIAEFGRGQLDDRPLFQRVTVPGNREPRPCGSSKTD